MDLGIERVQACTR